MNKEKALEVLTMLRDYVMKIGMRNTETILMM